MKTTTSFRFAKHLAALALAALAVAACDPAAPAGAPSNGPAAGAGSCSENRSAASEALQKVIEQNSACTKDSDCVTIGFGASCFDACTRTIAASGKAAFEAAAEAVDAKECKAYADAGCPRPVPPPCAPPMPPACKAGKCQ